MSSFGYFVDYDKFGWLITQPAIFFCALLNRKIQNSSNLITVLDYFGVIAIDFERMPRFIQLDLVHATMSKRRIPGEG
jgi:hypothetical protein